MATKFITIKVTPETQKMLRLIAAMTEDKQYRVMEHLLRTELDRLRRKAEK